MWWAFAFAPLPTTPPEWLTAARSACFGSAENGMPGPSGWILLILAPASFLVAIFVLWGTELWASGLGLVRLPLGRCAVAVLAAAVLAEGTWVSAKLSAARATATWVEAAKAGDQDGAGLPPEYPRRTAVAPDFALVDQHGDAVSLARFRGRPVVLSFVFAHCQTMCPLIVGTLKQVAPDAPPVTVLLVTLDPWRDTPSTLPAIARQWQVPPSFHVLSSRNVRDVLRVVESYEVPFERNEKSGDIVHPGLVFVIDAEGRLAYTFNNPPPAWIREGLARVARAHAILG